MNLTLSPDGSIRWEKEFGVEHTVKLIASDIRRERTGVHAELNIVIDQNLTAYSTFNISRDEDRTRLSNSAHRHLRNGMDKDYPVELLKHDLDLFCKFLPQVWEEDRFPIERYDPAEVPPPLVYLLRPYIIEGAGTILFAPPGAGKSYCCMAMAISIAGNVRTLWEVEQRPLLYLNLERSGVSMRRRFKWVCECLGIGNQHQMEFLHARGQPFKSLSRRVDKWMIEHPGGVCIADSISRAGMGSLVQDDTANSIVDWLNGHFGTWLAIGHTTRASDEHTYGSIHFDAGEDVGIKLESETTRQAEGASTVGICLTITKANDIDTGQSSYLALEFREDRLKSIRKAVSKEFPCLVEKKLESIADRLIRYLLERGSATATQAAKDTGLPRDRITKLFTGSDLFVLLNRKGKEVYYALADNRQEDEEQIEFDGLPF